MQRLEKITLPFIPDNCIHNAHMFYLKCKSLDERTRLINFLKSNEIQSVFHYIPLHSSKAGEKFGYFHGMDNHTTKESEKLLRLPMYYDMNSSDIGKVIEMLYKFYL